MILPRKQYTVQQLVYETKNLLEASYPDIWVEGEVSDLATPPSGHRYFSLKDAKAVLRCVLFRSHGFQAACAPANGMQMLVRGRLSVYANRGDMQFVVSYVEEAGEGALRRAFEMLKRRLDAEGVFAAERKQQLPTLPRGIGVITSSQGAALHDVLVTLKRRYPQARVILYPATVQGDRAADEITTALGLADARQEVDLLLLVRGGGSLQDLQAFNEESVARAVSACSLPVVTGIGHETDFTIADFVADLRAPTPTGAAQAATPDIRELNDRMRAIRERLTSHMAARLATLQQQLDLGTRRLAHPRRKLEYWARHHRHLQQRLRLAAEASIRKQLLRLERSAGALGRHSPQARLRQGRQRLDDLTRRLHRNREYHTRDSCRTLGALTGRLQAVSPRNTLERGYAILTAGDGKQVIRRADNVAPGDAVVARLAHGALHCEVKDVLE